MNKNSSSQSGSQYWKRNLYGLGINLAIWFSVSFGCGILWRDWLDIHFPPVGHAPFGFWMAQQGSIIGFVVILIVYSVMMNKLDAKYGFTNKEK
ncbi:DUF4212 domain-containing protein [Verrucomicrobiaceae bacterium N1E253]|uniref:DUF4212 domain-containing protein n=2 Tax=Oceaniferula marina TaxID=2748318 RepID=A0A851GRH0_9BACT|nr:DUF4212 domain-containing protein [Oceaniferula marina]